MIIIIKCAATLNSNIRNLRKIMPLQRIEINGFRGFSSQGTLNFATPTGATGSGLTIITGPNNSGKSSILECLKARSGHQSPSFTVGARNSAVEEVQILYKINDSFETIKSIRKGASETKREGEINNFHIFVLPSRRAFSPYFSRSEHSREQHVLNSPLAPQRTSMLSGFEYRLFQILKDPSEFNRILHEVIPSKPEWSIDQSDQGQYFLKFFNGTNSHSSDGMGEGIVSIFSIVDSLYDSKPGDTIVIDEPELSLHPALQKRVSKTLNHFAKDRQIIISTHSPYFVDLEALANGGHLARVVTGANGSVIRELSPLAKEALIRLSSGNLYNPHVFGLDARELFFQEDQIILTEGQEDVLLYPKIAEQLGLLINGSFFGWGAGGAGNIIHLCRILSDLGYSRVAGLLDGDKIDERDRLKTEFPSFFFECIPAKDIRTKPVRRALEAVDGLLDANLLIKDEHKVEVVELFRRLDVHMTFVE